MYKSIRVKKAFTLIEIIIVSLLILTVLGLSSFNFNTQDRYKISLENIKEFMLENFEYDEELSLTCIEDEFLDCFVFIDRDINKDIKIENLFTQLPQVFNYNRDLTEYKFSKIRIDDVEYEPYFELKFNKDRKHPNIVLDTNDEKVYLFSSISNILQSFSNTNEVIDKFNDLEIEVKDAL